MLFLCKWTVYSLVHNLVFAIKNGASLCQDMWMELICTALHWTEVPLCGHPH